MLDNQQYKFKPFWAVVSPIHDGWATRLLNPFFFGAPWIKRKLLSMTKYVWVVRYFELCVWASMYVMYVCM